jgi:hypothetical protein
MPVVDWHASGDAHLRSMRAFGEAKGVDVTRLRGRLAACSRKIFKRVGD